MEQRNIAHGTDVAAAKAFGPIDAVDCGVGAGADALEIRAVRGDAEHQAVIGEEPLDLVAGACVEDLALGGDRRTALTANFAATQGARRDSLRSRSRLRPRAE